MPFPKCEGQIIFSANQTGTTNGGATWTVAAGTYYLTTTNGANSPLTTTFKTALDTAIGGPPVTTITIDDNTDSGTGKTSIAFDGGANITWTSTDIRDYLGFTGNLSSGTLHVSTNHCRYLWLPNVGRTDTLAPEPTTGATDLGVRERDLTGSMSPSGYMVRLSYNTRYKDTFKWAFVQGKKAFIADESVTNESFEKFYEDVVGKGRPFRYHSDRSSDSVYWTMAIPDAKEYAPRWHSNIRGATGGYVTIDYMMRKAVGE